MNARGLAAASVFALLALVLAWQLALAPPQRMPPAFAAALHALPLLPSLVLFLRRRPSAGFWGAVAALILFCHGISEAWSSADARALALAEVALSVTIIFGASWDGLRARFDKRRAAKGAPLQ
jgi:uncharacterized membrane protein